MWEGFTPGRSKPEIRSQILRQYLQQLDGLEPDRVLHAEAIYAVWWYKLVYPEQLLKESKVGRVFVIKTV